MLPRNFNFVSVVLISLHCFVIDNFLVDGFAGPPDIRCLSINLFFSNSLIWVKVEHDRLLAILEEKKAVKRKSILPRDPGNVLTVAVKVDDGMSLKATDTVDRESQDTVEATVIPPGKSHLGDSMFTIA